MAPPATVGAYVRSIDGDDGWPTLGELVDRQERLVVFAEEAGPPPRWDANAFEAMRETPFLFLSAERSSCGPNRGASDAPPFLLDHWVQRGGRPRARRPGRAVGRAGPAAVGYNHVGPAQPELRGSA